MAQKTTENWERLFLRFDGKVAGMAAAVTVASLLLASSPAITLIASGGAATFGVMAAVDANRLRRIRRDQKRKIATTKEERAKAEISALKRP